MAQQATGTVVAKKFANAYEESERLAAELSMFERGDQSERRRLCAAQSRR